MGKSVARVEKSMVRVEREGKSSELHLVWGWAGAATGT